MTSPGVSNRDHTWAGSTASCVLPRRHRLSPLCPLIAGVQGHYRPGYCSSTSISSLSLGLDQPKVTSDQAFPSFSSKLLRPSSFSPASSSIQSALQHQLTIQATQILKLAPVLWPRDSSPYHQLMLLQPPNTNLSTKLLLGWRNVDASVGAQVPIMRSGTELGWKRK